MKLGFTKILSRFRKEDEGNFDLLDPATLSDLSFQDLIQLVIKYDADFKDLHTNQQKTIENNKTLARDVKVAKEESLLYKTHYEEMQILCQKLNNEMMTFQKTNTDQQLELENLRTKSRNNEELVRTYKKQIAEMILTNNEAAELGEDIKIERNALKQSLRDKSKECAAYQMQLRNMESERDSLLRDHELDAKKLKQIRNELDCLKSNKEDLAEDLRRKVEIIEELKNGNGKLQSQIEHIKTDRSDYANSQLKDKLTSMKRTKEELREEIICMKAEMVRMIKQSMDQMFIIRNKQTIIESPDLQDNQEIFKNKINQLEDLNSQLQEALRNSEEKRETAKKELLKLSQKLKERSKEETISTQESLTLLPERISKIALKHHEYQALLILRTQLDNIYKHFMNLMITARTVHNKDSKTSSFIISQEDFTKFEKELNRAVMDVHESLTTNELPVLESQCSQVSGSWTSKLTSAVTSLNPNRLLSCVTKQNPQRNGNAPMPHPKVYSNRSFQS